MLAPLISMHGVSGDAVWCQLSAGVTIADQADSQLFAFVEDSRRRRRNGQEGTPVLRSGTIAPANAPRCPSLNSRKKVPKVFTPKNSLVMNSLRGNLNLKLGEREFLKIERGELVRGGEIEIFPFGNCSCLLVLKQWWK